jgi:hypothetical protein
MLEGGTVEPLAARALAGSVVLTGEAERRPARCSRVRPRSRAPGFAGIAADQRVAEVALGIGRLAGCLGPTGPIGTTAVCPRF